MIKIKCKCGYNDVFDSEKDAYLDGWYYSDGHGLGDDPNNQKPIEICVVCQDKERSYRFTNINED